MNANEPVAWIEPDVIPLTYIIKAVVRREQDEQYSIPLYTHPVKELTDEEITACIDESEPDTADMIRFARAVIKEVSGK